MFTCEICGKIFQQNKNLNRHKRSVHGNIKFSCSKCSKEFTRKENKDRHELTCDLPTDDHRCPRCNKLCATAHGLKRHMSHHAQGAKRHSDDEIPGPSPPKQSKSDILYQREPSPVPQPGPSSYKCRRCNERFDNRRDLYLHNMTNHYQVGGQLQDTPWGNQPAPWEGSSTDERLKTVYEANAPLILQPNAPGPNISTYNFPTGNDVDEDQIRQAAEAIYDRQDHAFKLNLSFGVILRHRETGEYRYFRPFYNDTVLDRPLYISKRRDLRTLTLKLRRMDLFTLLLQHRPDTKWVPVLVTNFRFTIFHTFYPIGDLHGPLPDYVQNNQALEKLDVNKHTNKLYDDHYCAFRCLALHQGYDVKSLEGKTKQLFGMWANFKGGIKDFQGVDYEDLPDFESCFQINVEVYALNQEGHTSSIYKSRGRYEKTMYVHLYQGHFSYIKDFSLFAKKYQCKFCDKLWDHHGHYVRHELRCQDKTRFVYPGGFYKPTKTLFEELSYFGIGCPDQVYPWFIVYDFEAILHQVQGQRSYKVEWTHEHAPISVSIASNVSGFQDPQCIVNSNADDLVKGMVEYMECIAEKVKVLARERWGLVLNQLEQMIRDLTSDDDEEEDDCEKKKLKQLYGKLGGYVKQVPVLGFNSAKYDLNLIKTQLAKQLGLHEEEYCFTIKKNNAYACISTETLKFLDISHFLAPGTSYAKFLKAYQVEESKGHFPYEWFDDVSKLEVTELPPPAAFYSSLKQTCISDDEYDLCRQAWVGHDMTTFKDFLVWYNNLDVGPFVTAVTRLQTFYFDRNIDIFKIAMSAPGIARKMLFDTAKREGAEFTIFDERNKDLYHCIKRNIVGGPSIIYHRKAVKGDTPIRGGKLCQKVLGYDCNALYLGCIGQDMPVGTMVRRKAEEGFKPEVRDRNIKMYQWMNYLNKYEGKDIKHARNDGQEKRVGPYPVDGYDEGTNTIYQFHGCYFHGHQCRLTDRVTDEGWVQNREKKLIKTKKTTAYLKGKGYQVIEMWECDFENFCREHPDIHALGWELRPRFYRKYRGRVNETQILNGVRENILFGMVEVDIEVPERWEGDFRHALSPWEYFKEMSPLFCNTEVKFEDIGAHMQDHIKKEGLSDHPRRLLVGGMKAEKILLATPLLKWYLEHGLKVMRIYQVVEFNAHACFKRFVKDVTEARRAGDARPEMGIIGDTMKLIGNSGYGSLIMDKTKHRDIVYVRGERQTCLAINQDEFRNATHLGDEFYELEMAKKKISMDLPIQLGYFILQYGKLKMLEFNYDFLDVYVDRADYMLLEMDTDSNYLCISGETMSDVIKPEMRQSYEHHLRGFCRDDASPLFLPRECCDKHKKFDRRVPGLFKTEYEGDRMIGLCSKTYVVANGEECKFSSKGINKKNVTDAWETYDNVLKNEKAGSGINRGIRARDNTMFTYTQERSGFSYFYCKRRVLGDGLSTEPLDIILKP
ncbi:hypothetical protein FSP39_023489 [Pinctada imbricata]|uniref:DNA-directed DNA polymerase n=2 Tax=Pinctada imbricata TaxID=66713 RepID=A0AA88YNE1_PINIB|nr:hypothetical protein FSP39_023489 [Pinctada imbricata]